MFANFFVNFTYLVDPLFDHLVWSRITAYQAFRSLAIVDQCVEFIAMGVTPFHSRSANGSLLAYGIPFLQ
uniref:Uncharacterized protein n=1 Tax=Caenorhabditis japonica TaxID=281687 RepID=A0A8R1IDL7_CAEJA